MEEFLRSYGIWIFVGLFFLLMVLRRGHGCCGGSARQDKTNVEANKDEQIKSREHGPGCH